jgi:hypothetical protein
LRHVQHDLAIMNEAVRNVLADAVTALHRPDAISELPAHGEHLGITSLVSTEPAGHQHLGPLVNDLDRGRALMWSIPMITPTGLLLGSPADARQGGHRYFEQGKPLLSLSSRDARRDRRPERAMPMKPAGSRNVGASRRAPGPSLAGR